MKKASIIISSLILFSFLFLGGNVSYKSKVYENLVRNTSEVVEQGVKVQYKFSDLQEINDIKSKLNIEKEFSIYNEGFYYLEQNNKASIEIKGIDSIVEIEVKIFDDSIKVEELENSLIKIFSKKEDIKTFSYLKGKLKDEHNLENDKISLKRKLNVKTLEILEIQSGITGIAKLYNNEEYNFSLISYEKDNDYIIVGSPVIFTTY